MRTNIYIDHALMAEVLERPGLPTKKAAVQAGLREPIRRANVQAILELVGTCWVGGAAFPTPPHPRHHHPQDGGSADRHLLDRQRPYAAAPGPLFPADGAPSWAADAVPVAALARPVSSTWCR